MSPSSATIAPARTESLARRPVGHPDEGHNGASRFVPSRAEGAELLGQSPGSGYRSPPSLVRRADGQVVQLTPLLYRVLEAIDGHRGYPTIAGEVGNRIGKVVSADDIRFLVDTKLRPLGLLRRADGSEPVVNKTNPLLALRWKMVISNPSVTGRLVAPFTKLFLPQLVLPALIAFALAILWVLLDKGLASAMRQALYEPGLLLLVFGLTMLSTGFHELGHAAACRYGGATPGSMGVGLYLIWPAFYTDVTDSYRLTRGGRVRVDLGGLYFNAIFAVAVLGLWVVTRWDALLLIVPAQLLQMLRQLIPLVRFDGYHILADLTGVPDLFAHIKPILLSMLPTRREGRDAGALKPWVRAVVTLWVLLVVPVLATSLVLMVMVLPRVAATAWDGLRLQWEVLHSNWVAGEAPAMAVRLLSMFTIALPLLAMTYLLARIVRRTAARVLSATAGRPLLRTVAALAAAAGVVLLAWAWWPDGQYRPIQPDERGTLFDGIGSAARPREDMVPANFVYGAQAAGIYPPPLAASPGPRARPRLALILSPSDPGSGTAAGAGSTVVIPSSGADPHATSEQGWIFPFAPPPEPGEGDNQALAVNTESDSSVYDVSFALVWVTDGSVDQVNDAWALASCHDCRTVAVAFQAVFALGQTDVVVPQNIAVAVNYACERCQTYALASQLVATLTKVPSDDAMRELALIEPRLEELGRNIEVIPLNQLQAELAAIESAILEILVKDSGTVSMAGGVAQDSNTEVAATSGPGAGGGAEPAATPSDDPSPEPSEEPTTSDEPSSEPTPTEEPTPEPSPTN